MPQSENELAQQVRIIIMVYRQGWIDASEYLMREVNMKSHSIKKQYDSLVKDYPITKRD